jgi:hypothetical protein
MITANAISGKDHLNHEAARQWLAISGTLLSLLLQR